ncbi:MAG TPA: superinfection immunity protein [Candidatus Acidoferrales bacterium]|nr:superinfection immunity protein [Candidatus Acidoferrales bacterium]
MLTLLFLFLLYFLPTILARHKADAFGIFLVNLFLGWTVIGWVVALIWACASDDVVRVRYVPAQYVAAGYGPVSGGRFCSHCGTLAPVASRYCSSCGRAF